MIKADIKKVILIYLSVVPIASAKSWSMRRASQRPAFRSGCLTISHTYLPCPPRERTLLYQRCLLVIGREVSWQRWESSELGKASELKVVARWERCVRGVRWERWENSEVAQSERWEGNEVAIWERRRVVSRGGMEFKDKIVLN